VALYGEDLRTIGEFAVEAGARRRTLNLALYNAPIDVQNAMALATAYGPRRLRAGSSDMKKGCYGKPPAGTLATNQSPYPNSLLTGKLTGNFAQSGPPRRFRRPGQPVNSTAFSRIPCATEQGIFKCLSGNFFE
jgi:hypothetical protein